MIILDVISTIKPKNTVAGKTIKAALQWTKMYLTLSKTV